LYAYYLLLFSLSVYVYFQFIKSIIIIYHPLLITSSSYHVAMNWSCNIIIKLIMLTLWLLGKLKYMGGYTIDY